ncbi:MAG: hypothetical protein JJE22_19300 [Bacteroidia bacterium]|nr:hypothetical protein [Bacteroidia bacterium]
MKRTFLFLIIGSIFLSACRKETSFVPPEIAESCQTQTAIPSGRSYNSDSVVAVNYNKKVCGFLPLSKKNYWIYRDSIFNNGTFLKVQYDTLRYTSTFRSLSDSLIWWESNISVGLPLRLYTTETSLFEIENRFFNPEFIDAKKSYSLFEGDSTRYLSNFEDNAAFGRSVKIKNAINTTAGSFTDCILFEKNALDYRIDQVYFKPGFGVIKYFMSKSPFGSKEIKLQQVSTLVAFHFE